MTILGYEANAYQVTVVDVEKGSPNLAVPGGLRVGSTADGCSAEPYGEDGDQMLQEAPLRLYLTAGEDGLTTLTPFDGAQPVEHPAGQGTRD